jgi:hypothetical protein
MNPNKHSPLGCDAIHAAGVFDRWFEGVGYQNGEFFDNEGAITLLFVVAFLILKTANVCPDRLGTNRKESCKTTMAFSLRRELHWLSVAEGAVHDQDGQCERGGGLPHLRVGQPIDCVVARAGGNGRRQAVAGLLGDARSAHRSHAPGLVQHTAH